jgi:hypothetical protein
MRSFGLVVVLLGFSLAGCSDETKEQVDDAVESAGEDVEDAAGGAAARTAAETIRATLIARDLPDGQTVRDVAVLQDAAGDAPGDAEISGIEDGDGDGKDDDGAVAVGVGDQQACLRAQDNGDVEVSSGAC